jgi:hypothetical protein
MACIMTRFVTRFVATSTCCTGAASTAAGAAAAAMASTVAVMATAAVAVAAAAVAAGIASTATVRVGQGWQNRYTCGERKQYGESALLEVRHGIAPWIGLRVDFHLCANFPHTAGLSVGNIPSSTVLCDFFPHIYLQMLISRQMSSPAPTGDSPGATPPVALVRALRRALRPLVRLMVARGITLGYVVELLKSVLVEVADREFRIDGKPPTDSRVSLVTGVHRKDVGRLRQAMGQHGHEVPAVMSLGARLMSAWQGSAPFLDPDGQPLPLPRFASEGGPVSFEGLVASVNSDIRSRVVLDEWLRRGLVQLDEERRVCLNAGAFVPAADSDEKAFYFGHNLHDHAAAATSNLLGDAPPFLERSVHFGSLPAEVVRSLAQQAETTGMKALLAINKSARAERQNAKDDSSPRERMTFGMYFFSEPVAPADLAPGAPATDEPKGLES